VTKCTFEGENNKEEPQDGVLTLWQHYVCFGTQQTDLIKIPMEDIKEFRLVKGIFSDPKLVIDTNQQWIFSKIEELEQLYSVFRHVHAQRNNPNELLILGRPIVEMLGALKYPKENEHFHKVFGIPQDECLVTYFSCALQRTKSMAPIIQKGRLYVSSRRVCYEPPGSSTKNEQINIPFEKVKAIRDFGTKGITLATTDGDFTFVSLPVRDRVYDLLGHFWNEAYSKVKAVVYVGSGKITKELLDYLVTELLENYDIYLRLIVSQNSYDIERLTACGVDVRLLKDPKAVDPKEFEVALSQMEKLVLLIPELDQCTVNHIPLLIEKCPPSLRHIICVSSTLCETNEFIACVYKAIHTFIEESEIQFTFVRPNAAIMQFFLEPYIRIKREYCFRLPLSPTRKLAWVDIADVARVTAQILGCSRMKEAEHYQHLYYVSGPEALSCDEIAEIFSRETHKEIYYLETTPFKFREYIQQIRKELQEKPGDKRETSDAVSSTNVEIINKTVADKDSEQSIRKRLLSITMNLGVSSSADMMTKQLEELSEWRIERQIETFTLLEKSEIHGIISPLSEAITNRRPTPFREFVKRHLEHFKEKFVNYFNSSENVTIAHQFEEAKKICNNSLVVSEFHKVIGFAFNDSYIVQRLFAAFDIERDTVIDQNDFFTALSILMKGSLNEQLELAYRLLDEDNDGFVSRKEFASFIDAIKRVLSRMGIQNECISSLVDVFFSVLPEENEHGLQISTQRSRLDIVSGADSTQSSPKTQDDNTISNNTAEPNNINKTKATNSNNSNCNSSNKKHVEDSTPERSAKVGASTSPSVAQRKTTTGSNATAIRKTPSPQNKHTKAATKSPLKKAPNNVSASNTQNKTKQASKDNHAKDISKEKRNIQMTQPKKSAVITTNKQIRTNFQTQRQTQLQTQTQTQTQTQNETQTQTQTQQTVTPTLTESQAQLQCKPQSQLTQSQMQRFCPQPRRFLATKEKIDFNHFKLVAIRFKDAIESLGRVDANTYSLKKEHDSENIIANGPNTQSSAQNTNKSKLIGDVNYIVYDNNHYDMYKSQNTNRGLFVAFGNEQWELIQYILLGLWKLMWKTMQKIKTNRIAYLNNIHFTEEVEESLSISDDKESLWTITDYAPSVFWNIRDLFGVDQQQYLRSIGIERMLGGLLLGRLSTFEEIASSGRSGSFFLKTEDSKFFIKTLPMEEHLFFRKILPLYWSHLERYPNTLLPRFYGLHKLKSFNKKDGRTNEIFFIVMANLFDSPLQVHEQYDLKGSTVNRSVRQEEYWNPSIALKDLDFHRRIVVGPKLKALILEQAEIDCKWMESLNVCDYSLLVGFCFVMNDPKQNNILSELKKKAESGAVDRSLFKRFHGGLLSSEGHEKTEIYFIGIIDTLTVYDLWKKGENMIKTMRYLKQEISAIAPEPYRKRFLRYLSTIID
jgi:Ca2+-binding EF-hand superfamily protein/uncharacterized protein YbjT (DUF2867 family)